MLPPAGTFTPGSLDDPLVLVAGGSGITLVIAIAKSILFGGSGDVVLIYVGLEAPIRAGKARAVHASAR
ncbi:hypothetical protein AB0H60_11015 [Nocardia rhamnosiphila]|uniref:hypothetical protein n=1 Tax=Nocardia rhamnosiphila TaxID=426716 RepID=UPI0033DA47AD